MIICFVFLTGFLAEPSNMNDLKNLKIAFYGASVTQQGNGFVDYFSRIANIKVLKFGFGGMFLRDAGVCFVDKVIKSKPDICFVDWFSTDYINQDGKFNLYIDTITEKLQRIGCRVIFLFFPNNRNSAECNEFYTISKSYLQNKGVEFISLDKILSNYPTTEILRDVIHTSQKGSQLYAENILRYIENTPALPQAVVKPNVYSSFSVLPVKAFFNKKIVVEGNCYIQGFFMKIGPWSGMVQIDSSGDSFKENTWDQWCYYARDHFCFNLPVDGKVTFTVLNETFDTSSCEKNFDFSKYKKKLVIHEIYYYGGPLKVCTKGNKIAYLYALLITMIFDIKHRIFTKKNKIRIFVKKFFSPTCRDKNE